MVVLVTKLVGVVINQVSRFMLTSTMDMPSLKT